MCYSTIHHSTVNLMVFGILRLIFLCLADITSSIWSRAQSDIQRNPDYFFLNDPWRGSRKYISTHLCTHGHVGFKIRCGQAILGTSPSWDSRKRLCHWPSKTWPEIYGPVFSWSDQLNLHAIINYPHIPHANYFQRHAPTKTFHSTSTSPFRLYCLLNYVQWCKLSGNFLCLTWVYVCCIDVWVFSLLIYFDLKSCFQDFKTLSRTQYCHSKNILGH